MGIEWGRTLCHKDENGWKFVAIERLKDETEKPFLAVYDEIDLVEPDDDHREWIDRIASMCRFAMEPEGFAYLVFDSMLGNGLIERQGRFEDAEEAEAWLEELAGQAMEGFHTPQI